MSISRRKFIQVGAVTLLAAGVPIAGATAILGQELRGTPAGVIGPGDIPYASQQDPVFYFTKETFTPYINSAFQFQDRNGVRASFNLFAVDEYQPVLTKGSVDQTPTRSFSLYFTGGKRLWRSETYSITHPALGRFSLMVVPIVSVGQQVYEAVINHLN
jgi:hypothetical protein